MLPMLPQKPSLTVQSISFHACRKFWAERLALQSQSDPQISRTLGVRGRTSLLMSIISFKAGRQHTSSPFRYGLSKIDPICPPPWAPVVPYVKRRDIMHFHRIYWYGQYSPHQFTHQPALCHSSPRPQAEYLLLCLLVLHCFWEHGCEPEMSCSKNHLVVACFREHG